MCGPTPSDFREGWAGLGASAAFGASWTGACSRFFFFEDGGGGALFLVEGALEEARARADGAGVLTDLRAFTAVACSGDKSAAVAE